MIRLLAMVFALLLAACAPERPWTKPGVTPSVLEQDKLGCTEERPMVIQREIYRWRRVNPDCMRARGYEKDFGA